MSEETSVTIKDQQREAFFKADIIGITPTAEDAGGRAGMTNTLDDDPFAGMYDNEVIAPPYDAQLLSTILEQSSILPQCVEAMETNVEGFGYTLEAMEHIKKDEGSGKYPPDVEAERRRINSFFEYCNPDESFIKVRKKMRRDYEVVGYGFWEILRSMNGDLAGIEHVPAYTMRLCRLDERIVDVPIIVRDEDGAETETLIPRRFRRFVQIRDARKVYFKQFGDPRDMDANSGEFLSAADAQAVRATGKRLNGDKARIATEIIYFCQYNSRTPYGIPRWIGALPGVLGERAADEVNLNFFDNKGIPPLAVLVSGRLAGDSAKTIREHVEKNIKGRNNFHSILVMEVETPPNPMAGGARPSIDIKPLTDAIQKDALFREYRKDARDNGRSSFRLPKIYVGETDDYNRATADASRDVAEEQVFAPERDDFDFTINRILMPALTVKYWRFKTLAPTQDNATKLSELVERLSKAGLTPREARVVMGEIFNKDLNDPENADWLDMPTEIFLERMRQGLTPEQVEQAKQKAEEALKQAEAAAAARQQPQPGEEEEEGEGTPEDGQQPAQLAKSAGMRELTSMIIELRKAVLEDGEPSRTF